MTVLISASTGPKVNSGARDTGDRSTNTTCEIGEALKTKIDRTLQTEKSYPSPGISPEPDEQQRLAHESANARVTYMEHRRTCSVC